MAGQAVGNMQSVTGKVRPIPAGYHSITPYLTVEGVPKLIEFFKLAFHAVELERVIAQTAGSPMLR